MTGLKNYYIEETGIHIELKFTEAAGYKFQVNHDSQNSFQLPAEFINCVLKGKKKIFTTTRLVH